jgi:hypothetical protein
VHPLRPWFAPGRRLVVLYALDSAPFQEATPSLRCHVAARQLHWGHDCLRCSCGPLLLRSVWAQSLRHNHTNGPNVSVSSPAAEPRGRVGLATASSPLVPVMESALPSSRFRDAQELVGVHRHCDGLYVDCMDWHPSPPVAPPHQPNYSRGRVGATRPCSL